MLRRGQSLVETAVCLPFLILLLAAALEFGLFLHTRQALWAVAADASGVLARHRGPISETEISDLRRRMLVVGAPQKLNLPNVVVEPAKAGFYRIRVRTPHRGVLPERWLGALVEVQVLVPVDES
jgi:hypothetical protein